EPGLFTDPKLGKDLRGDAVRFGEQAEEDMLCAQEGVPAIAGHPGCLAQGAAQPGRQREALDLVHLIRHDARAGAVQPATASRPEGGPCAGTGTYCNHATRPFAGEWPFTAPGGPLVVRAALAHEPVGQPPEVADLDDDLVARPQPRLFRPALGDALRRAGR